MSSVFPDRLIHPLPKRRLRERLSPDVADSIQYPPAQASGTNLFYYPYNLKDDTLTVSERANVLNRGRAATTPSATPHPDIPASPRTRRDSEDDEAANSSRVIRLVSRSARPMPTAIPPPPEFLSTAPSTASSVDGYDSFENTNNKKKRKIPTVGDTPHAGSCNSADIHSPTPSSSNTVTDVQNGPFSLAGNATTRFVPACPGIPGPGRGRYGRSRGGRSPLHPLSDAGSNWAGRYGKSPQAGGNTGIISNAIANAEKQASRGQENPGFTHQQSATSTPASSQFTFTCTSQVPGNLTWPGSDPKLGTGATAQWQQGRLRGGYGQSLGKGHPGANQDGSVGSSSASRMPRGAGNGHPKPPGKKKGRNKLNRELEHQARERRRLQQEQNLTSPSTDDIYICPFCEFEAVNGYKPKYLIRSFEKKERKKRLEDDRRQRCLDKTKARGRKGKKASRAAQSAKNSSATESQTQGPQPDDATHEDPQAGDGYYEDDGGGEGDNYGPDRHRGMEVTIRHKSRAKGLPASEALPANSSGRDPPEGY